jgi:hypothetical protein
LSIRQTHEHIRHPFLGPDDRVLTLKGRTLRGSSLQASNLTPTQVNTHPLVRKLALHWSW